MKKSIIKSIVSLSLISLILVTYSAQVYANKQIPSIKANADIISVNTQANKSKSVIISFSDSLHNNIEGKLISNITYVALRSFLNTVGDYSIRWSQKNKTAYAYSENSSIIVKIGKCELIVNGESVTTIAENKLINNTTYVPIRPLAESMGYDVAWNQGYKTVTLSKESHDDPNIEYNVGLGTYGQFSAKSDSHYDYDDLYWLSRIISAEARGESIEGKLAVGNVVMNRMEHKNYPNTIKGVIFDDRYGIQFTPVANGYVYKDPTDESIFAAKIILEGYRMNSEIIYFVDTKVSPNSWVENNNTFVIKIGCHSFFK